MRDGVVTGAGLVSLLLSILPRPPERRDRGLGPGTCYTAR
jgi:hypothetical protein